MAEFHFRLAAVLRIREQERDEKRQELVQAVTARDILDQHREKLEEERRVLGEALRQSLAQGKIDADQMLAWRRYEMLLNAQREQVQRQIEGVEQEIEKRQAALSEANRAVKALELLRDRQMEEFNRGERRKEMKRLDEMAARIARLGTQE